MAADRGLAERVNAQVNGAWGQPPGYDCENYSRDKHDALVAAGVDPADLELRVVRVPIPGKRFRRFHQVLIVNVPGDRIVLNNMTRKVWPLATFERQISR